MCIYLIVAVFIPVFNQIVFIRLAELEIINNVIKGAYHHYTEPSTKINLSQKNKQQMVKIICLREQLGVMNPTCSVHSMRNVVTISLTEVILTFLELSRHTDLPISHSQMGNLMSVSCTKWIIFDCFWATIFLIFFSWL